MRHFLHLIAALPALMACAPQTQGSSPLGQGPCSSSEPKPACESLAMERREYYRGAEPFAIELEMQSENRPKTEAALSDEFKALYASKIDGCLLDRKVWYITPNGRIGISISSSGKMEISQSDTAWIKGQISESPQKKRALHVESASNPSLSGKDASLYLNGQELEIPGLKISVSYDARETDFINLKCFGNLFLFDIRYSTANNFAKVQLYPEPFCWMRYLAARNLMDAAMEFRKMGLKIKIFDTYRPRDVQFRMWEVVPDSRFVANPNTGSIHNRGGAVDMTLADESGDLDMGTDFDFFGPEAYPSCTSIPAKAQENRRLMREVVARHHFKAITSEWWHFSHTSARSFELSSFVPLERLDF